MDTAYAMLVELPSEMAILVVVVRVPVWTVPVVVSVGW
jgi:hypothetical protein